MQTAQVSTLGPNQVGLSTWKLGKHWLLRCGYSPYKAPNLSALRPRQRKQVMDQGLWQLVALVVLSGDGGAGAPWGPTRCMAIPQAMALCHNIGYTEMRLPHLLDHDTAAEAIQQSAGCPCWPGSATLMCASSSAPSLPRCASTGRAGAPR